MGEILVNFTFVGELITKEDLEETYRTLYFFESPWYVGYGKNNEKAQNQVWREFFLGVFFIAFKFLAPTISEGPTLSISGLAGVTLPILQILPRNIHRSLTDSEYFLDYYSIDTKLSVEYGLRQ